jgi:hypothetical protein
MNWVRRQVPNIADLGVCCWSIDCWQREPFVSLDQILLYAHSRCVHEAQIDLSFGVATIRRPTKAIRSLRFVLLEALTSHVQRSDTIFAYVVALIGGEAVPLHRLRIVNGYAKTVFVADTKIPHVSYVSACELVQRLGARAGQRTRDPLVPLGNVTKGSVESCCADGFCSAQQRATLELLCGAA